MTSPKNPGRGQEAGSGGGGGAARLPIARPHISQPLLRLFSWYARRYLRRHFHSLRVSLAGLPPGRLDAPTVIFSNHAAWWDPLVALTLRQDFFPDRQVYAPMEAAALERYGFFKRLGVFGVTPGTTRGAVGFLKQSQVILQSHTSILWLTPQARFADARERPVQLKPGIGHLPRLAERINFLPVAIEYVFWEERLPEILVRFGPPFQSCAANAPERPRDRTDFFAGQLTETQDALAAESQRRDPRAFRCLLRGKAGVGGVYDRWRAFKAGWRGETFQPEHGAL